MQQRVNVTCPVRSALDLNPDRVNGIHSFCFCRSQLPAQGPFVVTRVDGTPLWCLPFGLLSRVGPKHYPRASTFVELSDVTPLRVRPKEITANGCAGGNPAHFSPSVARSRFLGHRRDGTHSEHTSCHIKPRVRCRKQIGNETTTLAETVVIGEEMEYNNAILQRCAMYGNMRLLAWGRDEQVRAAHTSPHTPEYAFDGHYHGGA